MSIVYNDISSHTCRSFGGVSFLLFTMTSTIIFPTILSLCQSGDHVLLFPGSMAMMLWFQPPILRLIVIFFYVLFLPFFFHLIDRPKIQW